MDSGQDIVAKVRKIVKSGDSNYICIPPEFMRKHGLKAGDKLAVIADHIMKVVPMKEVA